jgi:guanine nucleotide-binding protein subunit alpha, other
VIAKRGSDGSLTFLLKLSQILFLNKNDLFEEKIPHSDIKNFFPDFEGEPGDVAAGRDYFKKRFARLAQKAGRSKEREVYIQLVSLFPYLGQ